MFLFAPNTQEIEVVHHIGCCGLYYRGQVKLEGIDFCDGDRIGSILPALNVRTEVIWKLKKSVFVTVMVGS